MITPEVSRLTPKLPRLATEVPRLTPELPRLTPKISRRTPKVSCRGSETDLHTADATKTLGSLRDQGLLRMAGAGRGARYQLDPSVLSFGDGRSRDRGLPDGVSSTAVSARSTVDSARSTMDSPRSTALLAPPSHEAAGSLIDDPDWSRLQEIAHPVATTDYISAEERDDVIVALCAMRPLALVEIMWLVNRDKAYPRAILKQLLNAGRLRYLYPDRPRHPAQRELAAEPSDTPAAKEQASPGEKRQ